VCVCVYVDMDMDMIRDSIISKLLHAPNNLESLFT